MAILLSGTVASNTPSLPFLNAPIPVSLPGGASYMIPAGPHAINPGQYSEIQQYDGVAGFWRKAQMPGNAPFTVDSDGANYRLFNTTGMAIGAVVTNGGTSYTSNPTITSSFGGSQWTSIIGGSINTTITVTTAGTYTYPPTLLFSAPPAGGVRASAIATLSGSGLGTPTVINAGAGYLTAPTITIVPDPRENSAAGGVLTVNATLANSGIITAVVCTDPGTSTSTSVPTLTFSGGFASGGVAASATAIMNFVVNGWSVTDKGSSLGTSLPLLVETLGYKCTATPANTSVDPQLDVGLAFSRAARLMGFTNSSGNIIASNTSLTTIDAGWGFQQAPSLIVTAQFSGANAGVISPLIVPVVGPITDTSFTQRLSN